MGTLEITKTSQQHSWNYTENEWKLVGTSQHNKVDNAFDLANFNCQIYKVVNGEDNYLGDASGYNSGDGIKTNISNVPTADLPAVATVVNNLVEALQEV